MTQPQRRSGTDPARQAAYDVLRAVADSDAYANLVLPGMLAERRLGRRDAAFATELAYGTLRLRGRYDAVLERCSSRSLREIDPRVLDALRLGAHQLLGMRVPPHAAVGETVNLVRGVAGPGAATFANAVLRSVGRASRQEWFARLEREIPDETERLATIEAHPTWIVRELRASLAQQRQHDGDEHLIDQPTLEGELRELLRADNEAPQVTLVARPGLVDDRELEEADELGRLESHPAAPTAWLLRSGSPERIPALRQGRMGVQDAGSQLVTLAMAGASIEGTDDLWADLCAGPGGKSALLGAVLAERAGRDEVGAAADAPPMLVAGEVQPHRVGLVRRSVKAIPSEHVEVVEWDGRTLGEEHPEHFDRILVDAPCTGLGALRRRPESRWRRQPADVPALTALQTDLLDSALRAVRPGGVVGYVTCSPHLAETRAVVDRAVARRDVEVLDAVAAARDAGARLDGLGEGPYLQLWPHRHGTDAMFLALLRRR
ncbi:RsmB/NOP family class I SAM-dependent RNA methyltransferase [Serinibacter salmoneus]|uniref:16S rRNA (Cytosine967-C5)-methyltransferase n=1 Tax=Serinibacter salmoneus TaxID=556530 RepID=A0A2A9CZV3_9MICO|nr:transcription antitermination factor NusB [Serinibacter salmoneus]PFG19656.1 16S rRNA (cytosine967-C5)-methyltransferase [Serinibacter salmoneus]